MASATPEEREQFRETWLDSVHAFNAETKHIRSVKDKQFLKQSGIDPEA